LINYYDILGLSSGAGSLEIKTAFRRLAKLYHPDKNPSGKEHFTKVLKAYEVLSDPIQKSTYDYRLKYQSINSSQTFEPIKTGTKNWRFDEKELKRRQYYNDYIKKQTQEANSFQSDPQEKKKYSDYKYLFFATPLAVILFLLIMHAATTQRTFQAVTRNDLKTAHDTLEYVQLRTGTSVYTEFFGPAKYDNKYKRRLVLNNNTSVDVIVCLFLNRQFLQCVFIEKNDRIELSNLPAEKVQLRFSSGLNFVPSKKVKDLSAKGIFNSEFHFYKCLVPLKLRTISELVLKADREIFKEITEKEFFTLE